MTDDTQIEMPKWDCHKTVWALPIAHIGALESEDGNGRARGYMLYFAEPGYAPKAVEPEVLDRAIAALDNPLRIEDLRGGYFVVYEDGYESYSPKEAFEAGYTRQRDPQ